jgi:hypothetical protein
MVAPTDAHPGHAEHDATERRKPGPPPGASPIYGLGFIGALVWFCRQADDPQEYGLAVLKALVWPAILVYEAFRYLQR